MVRVDIKPSELHKGFTEDLWIGDWLLKKDVKQVGRLRKIYVEVALVVCTLLHSVRRERSS